MLFKQGKPSFESSLEGKRRKFVNAQTFLAILSGNMALNAEISDHMDISYGKSMFDTAIEQAAWSIYWALEYYMPRKEEEEAAATLVFMGSEPSSSSEESNTLKYEPDHSDQLFEDGKCGKASRLAHRLPIAETWLRHFATFLYKNTMALPGVHPMDKMPWEESPGYADVWHREGDNSADGWSHDRWELWNGIIDKYSTDKVLDIVTQRCARDCIGHIEKAKRAWKLQEQLREERLREEQLHGLDGKQRTSREASLEVNPHEITYL
jgi:hypothetical protein